MLIASKSREDSKKVKLVVKNEFDMKTLGESKRILVLISTEKERKIIFVAVSVPTVIKF